MATTTVREQPDPVVAVNFMAARLVGKAGERGRSSDALIAGAVTGKMPTREFFPLDLGDLHRCLEAYMQAPHQLRRHMRPILDAYMESLTKSGHTSSEPKP